MVKAPKASAFGAFCIVLNENCEGKSAAELCLFRRNTGFTAAHGEDGLFHQFLQRPAKTVSAGLDHVTGASGGELLVLVFLFQTADLHVHDALAGAHPGGCADQAGQLVGGKENLI